MKKAISINKQIESLTDAASKEGLQVSGFDFTFKKETIQFEVGGLNQEKIISLRPELPEFENTQATLGTTKSVKNVQLFSTKIECYSTRNMLVSGNDRTNSSGQYLLNIKDKFCGDINNIDQSNFVATPVSNSPAILTFTINKQNDTITIFSYDVQGNLAEGIRFHWHLMLNYFHIID